MNTGTNMVGIIGMLLVLSSLGCHVSDAQTRSQAEHWVEHKDPAGFAVQCPQGWEVETAKDGHVLIHNADKSLFSFAVPFKWNGGGSSSEWIGPLVKHYSALFPNAEITQNQQINAQPDEAIAKATFTANGKACQANVLCCIGNGYGMLFAIAAPGDVFAARKPALIKILTSFRSLDAAGTASAPKGGATDGPITYKPWTDPLEGAFTVEVPSDWIVAGGMYRASPVDIRPQINFASRDGLVRIQSGDAGLTTCSPPNQVSQSLRMREGQSYNLRGCTYTLMHFMDGVEFSRYFVQQKMGEKADEKIADLQITASKDLPELAEKASQQFGKIGVPMQVTFGQTDFSYTVNGKAMRGRCFARTQLLKGYGAIWVPMPTLITAPADRIDMATGVFLYMLTHTKGNPEWEARLNETAAAWSRMITQDFNRTMAMRQQQYEKFTSDLQENGRVFNNALLGQVDLRSPSGETIKADGGFGYYWQKGGVVVGTNTNQAPGINATLLQQY